MESEARQHPIGGGEQREPRCKPAPELEDLGAVEGDHHKIKKVRHSVARGQCCTWYKCRVAAEGGQSAACIQFLMYKTIQIMELERLASAEHVISPVQYRVRITLELPAWGDLEGY